MSPFWRLCGREKLVQHCSCGLLSHAGLQNRSICYLCVKFVLVWRGKISFKTVLLSLGPNWQLAAGGCWG